MNIGYARVSTEEQNLSLQLDALTAAGCEQVFQDEGRSGADERRPGLAEALAALQSGDTLTVWKTDRLSRSLVHLALLLEAFEHRGVQFKSLTEPFDTTTPAGRLVMQIMGGFAEYERQNIRERVKAGMAAAKKRGKHTGRPRKLSAAQITHARELVEQHGRSGASHAAELFNVHPQTVRRELSRN